jgi:hypothetical protein
VSLALVLLAAAGMLVYREHNDDTRTYRGHGVSFQYPDTWRELSSVTSQPEGGAEKRWKVAVGPGGPNLAGIDVYDLTTAVTADNINEAETEVAALLRQSYEEQLGGTVKSGPDRITVAGRPGFRLRSTITDDGGAKIEKGDYFSSTAPPSSTSTASPMRATPQRSPAAAGEYLPASPLPAPDQPDPAAESNVPRSRDHCPLPARCAPANDL